jgi:putative ABC transport system permease protein
MFTNYLLLSLKVLKRKPLYTFISLFGISFTLMILMLLTSLFDATLGANKPLTHRDRMVMVPMAERIRMEPDTTRKIDSIVMDDGQMRYDTTLDIAEEQVSNSSGPMGYKFVNKYLLPLEGAQHVALFSEGNNVDGYLDGRKFSFNSYYVNDQYWDVFDFDFLHGGRLNVEDDKQANKVAVITDKSAMTYFGKVSKDVIGQEMLLGEETFRVRGIVSRPLSDSPFFSGDIYLPITTIDPRRLEDDAIGGGFGAVCLVSSPGKREALKNEINFLAENFDMSADDFNNKLKIFNASFVEGYAQGILQEEDPGKAMRMMFIPIIGLLLLFVALPLINLVNLNISRVYERKEEIGVRKAFGANAGDILTQFVFENMVLTLIGGLVGMLLAISLINYINANDLLGLTRLSYSVRVFLYFFLVIVVFGFLSGILPAYRMSRTNVADSLR